MIEWKKYDPTSREIESHTDHLVTNGHRTLIAQHASVPGTGKYSWMINNTLIGWVTHYAKINLPDATPWHKRTDICKHGYEYRLCADCQTEDYLDALSESKNEETK